MMKDKHPRKYVISALFLLCSITSMAHGHAIEGEHEKTVYGLSHSHDNKHPKVDLLKKALQQSPENSSIAANLAKTLIQLAKQEAQPEYYHEARAALSPWWNDEQAPVEILLLKATLLQHDHHFEAATKDLLKVIRTQSNHAQAWLTLSNIQIVQGQYDHARASCDALSRISSQWIASACFSQVDSLTGQANRAYTTQKALLEQSRRSQKNLRQWMLGLLSDTSMRLGKQAEAEEYYKAILSMSPHDTHTLRKYADLLITQERYAELPSLLATKKQNNALELRSLIAAKQEGKSASMPQTAPELEKRLFADEEGHHGHVHKQEQALFLLEIKQQPKQALSLALENWEKQKEFDDTAIILRAALASNDQSAVKPVLDWLSKQNVKDARFDTLIAQFNSEPV